jgi:hypothetical protein
MPYDPKHIEPKWQQYWEVNGTFAAEVDPTKPKFYVLDMFPYPSGEAFNYPHLASPDFVRFGSEPDFHAGRVGPAADPVRSTGRQDAAQGVGQILRTVVVEPVPTRNPHGFDPELRGEPAAHLLVDRQGVVSHDQIDRHRDVRELLDRRAPFDEAGALDRQDGVGVAEHALEDVRWDCRQDGRRRSDSAEAPRRRRAARQPAEPPRQPIDEVSRRPSDQAIPRKALAPEAPRPVQEQETGS